MNLPARKDTVDSGVLWLGAIPSGWVVTPLKYTASFQNGCAFKPDDWSDEGIPIIRIENLNGGDDFNSFDGYVDPRFTSTKALFFLVGRGTGEPLSVPFDGADPACITSISTSLG